MEKLGRVGYMLNSNVESRLAFLHANRLRKLNGLAVETCCPRDEILPDNRQNFHKILDLETRRNEEMERTSGLVRSN